MSVINWAEKPYPWNEIGPEWVAKLQTLAEKPVESRVVQKAARALPPVQRAIHAAQRVSEARKKGPWV